MQSIDIRLKRSKKLTFLMVVLLIGSMLIIVNLTIPWWLKILLVMVSVTYGFRVIQSSYALREIRHMTGNAWHLLLNNDQLLGELCGDSTVTRVVAVLRFRVRGKRFRQSYVILKDSMQEDEYRRLLVYLKCQIPRL